MKKYWKLLLLGIITVSGLTLFFIQNSKLIQTLPKFHIATVKGDEKILENIQVAGELYYGMFADEAFYINKDGTTYHREMPYLNRVSRYGITPKLEKLIKNHKNFLRGKYLIDTQYAENDEKLVYVNEDYNYYGQGIDQFSVDVLDKATNKSTAFTVNFPDEQIYYLYISDIAVTENNIYIMTFQENNDSDLMSAYIYTIDIEQQEIIEQVHLDTMANSKHTDISNGYVDVDYVPTEQAMEAVVSVHDVVYVDETVNGEYGESEVINTRHILWYDMLTGEEESYPLDKAYGKLFYYENGIGTFSKVENDMVTLQKVDLVTGEIVKENTIAMNETEISSFDFTNAVVENGKVYVMPIYDEQVEGGEAALYVIDLESLAVAYEGEIRMEGERSIENLLTYYFHSLSLTE